MNLGGAELLIIVAIAVMLFGAGWLPKAARNLGKAKLEFDEVQKQFNEAKDSVVEATGVKELESTVRKANKALATSPQKLMKDAAKSAVTGGGAAAGTKKPNAQDTTADTPNDDGIEDAEIIEPAKDKGHQDMTNQGKGHQDKGHQDMTDQDKGDEDAEEIKGEGDDNINVDFG